MNKFLLKLTTLLLVFAGVASTCNPEPEKEYPKKISFTEYSLLDTDCQWANLPYDEKVLIINSAQELEKYISCTGGSYPAIDFTKNTLLLASGYTKFNISEMNIQDLKQVSANRLILDIDMHLKYRDCTDFWHVALIVEKLSHDNHIKLNITALAPKVFRPLPYDYRIWYFFSNALPDCRISPCVLQDIDIEKDTCIVINHYDEYQQFCECVGMPFPPEIDFEKYSLVIGKTYITNLIGIADQKIVETDVLTILILLYEWYDPELIPKPCLKYHWGVYPKLPDKPLFVEYKYEDELKK